MLIHESLLLATHGQPESAFTMTDPLVSAAPTSTLAGFGENVLEIAGAVQPPSIVFLLLISAVVLHNS